MVKTFKGVGIVARFTTPSGQYRCRLTFPTYTGEVWVQWQPRASDGSWPMSWTPSTRVVRPERFGSHPNSEAMALEFAGRFCP